MQVQPQLGMEPKPNQVCMMIFDHDSVLVIFLHINLAWFGLCFDLRSNLHAARKLTWMYMGINLQARVFFCFFLFWAVGATFSMRFRRSAGQNTQDWPCAVGCRTRGHTRPGPRAFRAKAAGRTAELTSKPDFSFVLFGSWLWVRIFRCGFDGAPARTPEIGPAPMVAAPGAILARARALSGRKAAGRTAELTSKPDFSFVLFCFVWFLAMGSDFSMRFRRSAGQNTRDWPCAVGCRTRGHTRPGPRAFRAKSGRPYCRVVGEVAGRGRVGQDDVRGVPGPHPRGGRHRPRQGVWPGGSGALGGPGTAPPAPWSPPPARRTASYR